MSVLFVFSQRELQTEKPAYPMLACYPRVCSQELDGDDFIVPQATHRWNGPRSVQQMRSRGRCDRLDFFKFNCATAEKQLA